MGNSQSSIYHRPGIHPNLQHTERRAAAPSDPKPHIDVMSAIKTAIHALVFSAISDAAATQQEINKIKKKKKH